MNAVNGPVVLVTESLHTLKAVEKHKKLSKKTAISKIQNGCCDYDSEVCSKLKRIT